MLKHCTKIKENAKNAIIAINYIRDMSVSLRRQNFTTWSNNHMKEWLILGKSDRKNVVIENDITESNQSIIEKVPVLDKNQERISYIK